MLECLHSIKQNFLYFIHLFQNLQSAHLIEYLNCILVTKSVLWWTFKKQFLWADMLFEDASLKISLIIDLYFAISAGKRLNLIMFVTCAHNTISSLALYLYGWKMLSNSCWLMWHGTAINVEDVQIPLGMTSFIGREYCYGNWSDFLNNKLKNKLYPRSFEDPGRYINPD